MKTLIQYKTEQMKNSAFAKEYEAIQSEMLFLYKQKKKRATRLSHKAVHDKKPIS